MAADRAENLSGNVARGGCRFVFAVWGVFCRSGLVEFVAGISLKLRLVLDYFLLYAGRNLTRIFNQDVGIFFV